jgi:restriction system protein
MAIPDFQSLMLPLMRIATDRQTHLFRDAVEVIAREFGLSEADRSEMLPSGGAPLFYNRLAWAKTHLKMAGLLELPQRGAFKITESGTELMSQPPVRIDLALLRKYPAYLLARAGGDSAGSHSAPVAQVAQAAEATPEEAIEQAHHLLQRELADEVLASIMKCRPIFFERLIVQLMIKMGYGGSREEAGRAVGRSGDGGIDGIINEDRLGLDAIYLQAKRWEGVVGRPEIMRFVGALAGQRANKGVFITTSRFTQEAKDYAISSQYKVVLIDGERLADLMIEHDLGVSVAAIYQLKRIDSDFFSED